jgi:drug/metabolite transporter (DMT)-like permease
MWRLVIAAVFGASLALCLGVVFGRTTRSREGNTNPQSLAFAGAAVLGFFALFTGFSIASSWQELNSARLHTYDESRALTEVYWSARDLPADDRQTVRGTLRSYTQLVISDEWPQMADGRSSAAVWAAADRVRAAAEAVKAQSPAEVLAKSDTLQNLTDLYTTRNSRLADIRAAVPGLAIGGLVVGSALVVATPAVIGLTANRRNLMVLGFVGATVTFAVGLVLQLSGPFSGVLKVQPAAYQSALTRFDQIDGENSSV